MAIDEPTLPGMPELPKPVRVRKLPAGTRCVRVTPTKLCERCCYLIHLRGQGGAPYPRAGRWKVTIGAGEMRLCDTHKDERIGR